MQTIAVACVKGGTGKSTTAAALLQAAASQGRRVLGVDLDAQANLTFFLAANQNLPGAVDVLHGRQAAEVIQHTAQGLDVIAGSPDLAAETTRTGSAKRLATGLLPIKSGYGLCVIDTPPTIGELTFNALQAADGLLIPLDADNSSIQGLYQIADVARQINSNRPEFEILGVVVTRYDGRPKLNRFYLDAIKEASTAAGTPFLKAIRQGIAVKEAQALQRSLYDYAPKCKAAQDYAELYGMIVQN